LTGERTRQQEAPERRIERRAREELRVFEPILVPLPRIERKGIDDAEPGAPLPCAREALRMTAAATDEKSLCNG